MNQVILMTVFHAFYDLPEKYLGSLLIQFPLLFNKLEQLSTLQAFHNNSNLHVLQSQAVVHLNNVLVVE